MLQRSRRIFQPHALKPPRDFKAPHFEPITSDIWLEIGAGRGLHAMQIAQQHSAVQLYAIERTAEKFKHWQRHLTPSALPNLHAIHADAVPWIVYAIPPQSIQKIFILYPNPEPKNASQRWLNMPFFEFLLSRLKPNGQIVLASNIPDYIEEAVHQAQAVWQLPVALSDIRSEDFINNGQPVGRTHFEIKYLARGEPCQALILTKPVDYVTLFDTWVSADA